jgi:hypothetical protein
MKSQNRKVYTSEEFQHQVYESREPALKIWWPSNKAIYGESVMYFCSISQIYIGFLA